jgi:hypothetical protein
MKINVKKLDATIAKLQELRRLATDPALAAFVELTGSSRSRNSASVPNPLTDSNGSDPLDGPNGTDNGRRYIKGAVLMACRELPQFTAQQAIEAMTAKGITVSNPKSVANVLRTMAVNGELRVVEEGRGRRATKYAA